MTFLRVVWLVMRKDLLVELRSREILYTTAFFAVSCVLVFAFGFVREGQPMGDVGAGILWIAVAFSGTLALGRAFERERQSETLRALLLAPVDRPALYVAKLLGVMTLMTAVQLVIVPLVALLFQAPLFDHLLMVAALLFTGTVGFTAVGTMFAAMLARARSRDVLLPVLLYPITVPVIIAGVRGTAALLQADPDPAVARAWLSLLVSFDVVFITLALWTFEPVMTDLIMQRIFLPLALLVAAMFAYAPLMIANAPIESTMLLVQKIFYFHVPSWFVMFSGAFLCAGASVRYLAKGSREADHYAVTGAEIAVVFGLIGLITGPLWARKAWGVWWEWDVKLTLALVVWLTFVAYMLLRRYGGPGSEKLAAGVGIFGAANIPFVYYSVNWWRTIHPKTTVVPTLQAGMRGTFWFCVLAFMLLMVLIVAARVRLERQRARVDELYLSLED